jgi:hypothetical protein
MKRILVVALSLVAVSGAAQTKPAAERALYTTAHSGSTRASAPKSKPGSQYVVIRLQKDASQQNNNAAWNTLKGKLQKNGVEVTDLDLSSAADVQSALTKYGLTAKVVDQHITVQSKKMSGRANCDAAVVVVEDGTPSRLLLGKYETSLKQYFGLVSTD